LGRKLPDTGVVIAAGGSGVRLGGRIPKQFRLLNGKPVIQIALRAFENVRPVRQIVIVVPKRYLLRTQRVVAQSGARKVVGIVPGGRTRQESVLRGLRAFGRRPDVVLVHDAARPFVHRTLILDVLRKAGSDRAAVPALPVRDTIKLSTRAGYLSQTLDRSKLWVVQTPQGFHFDLLFKAHRLAARRRVRATDDAALVERLGVPVCIVRGSLRNIKITERSDLLLAKKWSKTGFR